MKYNVPLAKFHFKINVFRNTEYLQIVLEYLLNQLLTVSEVFRLYTVSNVTQLLENSLGRQKNVLTKTDS